MISLQQVNRTFYLGDQPVHALNNINLDINPGEYLSVMGPSGSGKSTLLNIMGLLDRPDSGDYLVENQSTATLAEADRAALRRNHIGFVFQSYHLISRLTARENITLPMILSGISSRKRNKRVTILLEQLGLTEREGHLPSQLSGGQRQRVAIGRAIIMSPNILLADEPTGNLDSRSGTEVIQVLENLNREGITLLVVTHDPDLGARANRKIQMMDGKITQDLVQNSGIKG